MEQEDSSIIQLMSIQTAKFFLINHRHLAHLPFKSHLLLHKQYNKCHFVHYFKKSFLDKSMLFQGILLVGIEYENLNPKLLTESAFVIY